jgi:hypothetical protein
VVYLSFLETLLLTGGHSITSFLAEVQTKQHILSSAKVKKVYYSLAELYVKSVYLNLFGWRAQAVNVWEPLTYML